MEFVTLTNEEFKEFSKNHEYTSFFQTIAWGKSKENIGWKMYLVGVKEKNKILAATMILEKNLIKKIRIFYSPRGFLIDYRNQELLNFFIDNIKKYAKEKKALFIKIDPYVENFERDKDGKIIENGYSNNDIIKILERKGFKHQGFNLEQGTKLQGRWLFVTPTKNKTIEEIEKGMEKSVKRQIAKNEKLQIEVVKKKESDIEEFYNIMKSTSDRRNFASRSLNYYKNMYHELHKENLCELYFVVLNTKKAKNDLEKQIEIKKQIINQNNEIFDKATIISENQRRQENGAIINVKKFEERKKQDQNDLNILVKQLEEIENIRSTHKKDEVTLSGILEIFYGDEVLGLYGGTYEEFTSYSPFNMIHHYILKYACKNNLKRYNYYAISGNLNKDDEQYGIYYTKRSLGGKVVELIGEFDLILNKPLYYLYKMAFAIKIKLKKFRK